MRLYLLLTFVGISSTIMFGGRLWAGHPDDRVLHFSGNAEDLQQAIDRAPGESTILCDDREIEVARTINIHKPLTLKGLKAYLTPKLGRVPMIVVSAERVHLADLELKGNYDSVDQADRAPMIWLQKGQFTVQRCQFIEGSKDGLMVTPTPQGGDLVGGTIRDIEALRMGRDAVSISGGNRGQKVRNVTVQNVSLRRGYHRGAVEVSDGTNNITVRHVYAERAAYGVDIQDHRGKSAANTNVLIDGVEAVGCRHVIRTANSPRGHDGLTLRNLVGRECDAPVRISHTKNVTLERLTLTLPPKSEAPPVQLNNCQNVMVKDLTIKGATPTGPVVQQKDCQDVTIIHVTD